MWEPCLNPDFRQEKCIWTWPARPLCTKRFAGSILSWRSKPRRRAAPRVAIRSTTVDGAANREVASISRRVQGPPRPILCCRREGCQRRTPPPSTLFQGRRVYWSAVILVSVLARQLRLEGRSARALQLRFGVTHRTLLRWIGWFETSQARTRGWRTLRRLVPASVSDRELPSSLLAALEGEHGAGIDSLEACLRLLSGEAEARLARGLSPPQKLPDRVR